MCVYITFFNTNIQSTKKLLSLSEFTNLHLTLPLEKSEEYINKH